MRSEEVRVPALRFPEFSGEWREVKLGEVASIIDGDRGKNYPKSSDFSEDGYCLFLNAKNVTENGFDFSNKMFISREKNILLNNGQLNRFDVVLTTRGSVGHIAFYDNSVSFSCIRINSGMVILRALENLYAQFLSKYLSWSKIHKGIKIISFGSAQPQLTVKEIKKIKLNIPSLPEQQKIADFHSAVDEKITLSQEKITRLEAYKKGMMQKLLSGELRFPGFTDAWREVKLGEISTISTGTSKSKFIQEKGKYLIVDMGSISSDGKLIASKKTNYNSDFLKAGVLVMPKDDIGGGNIIGKTAYIDVNNKYIMGDHIYKISIIQDNSKFIHYLINSYKINKILRRRATGTAQLGLNKNSVSTVSFKLPSLPEQQKIADFLSAIDDKLTLEKERLEALKRYKQGLLQKMFV